MKRYIVVALLCVFAVLALTTLIQYPPFEEDQVVLVRDGMSLRHISERNDVPLDVLVPLLPTENRSDFLTTFRSVHKPLSELEINHNDIRTAILQTWSEGIPAKDLLRYVLLGIWVAGAGWLLVRQKRLARTRTMWLIVTFVLFGVVLGSAPNPMEAVVRLHKLINGIPGNPFVLVVAGFVVFTLLSILGSRMLCSWGCPLGALQESMYNIPLFQKFKKTHKFPFAASISIRLTIYTLFFLLLFGILNLNQGGPGSILYHHLNLFKIFDPHELAVFTLFLIPIFVVASVVVFRPFCHTICPFGLWAWLSERVAYYRIRRVDPEVCVDCSECEDACPTGAMAAINADDGRFFLPDCWSCAKCIDACPNEVLEWAPPR